MSKPPGAVRLIVEPVDFETACALVDRVHRHHRRPRGHKFSVAVRTPTGHVAGVAITGRPVSRCFDNAYTFEVTRVATDGTPNACSALYGAAWRTARAQGCRRIITYTQDGESGASLRAAGWRHLTDLPARPGWDAPSRPRADRGTDNIQRSLWENTTKDAPALPDLRALRDEIRDEIRRGPHCAHGPCKHRVSRRGGSGRPPRFCSPACRQAAYRARKETTA